MQIKTFQNAPKFSILQNLAVTIQSGTRAEASQALHDIAKMPEFSGASWRANFAKLARVFDSGAPEFKIFAMGGNSKLPFVAFSTLPGVTCPGAGACLDFCYSFRAWRYPAAFARMAQNAFLLRHHSGIIANDFLSICAVRPGGFDFRLYVDGDFSSSRDCAFWFALLKKCPMVRAYGYSKSFGPILDFVANHGAEALPANYMLNISGGHNSDAGIIARIKELTITRGEFIAVSIGRKVKSTDHGTPENNRAIRDAMPGQKVFPCPGKCGTCTGAGHACGLPQMRGRIIAIAMH